MAALEVECRKMVRGLVRAVLAYVACAEGEATLFKAVVILWHKEKIGGGLLHEGRD